MGNKSSPSTTQTSSTELSPEQRKIFDLAFPYAEQYASNPLKRYQGSGIAGFDALETQAQNDLINNIAPGVQNLANASSRAHMMMLDPSFMLDVGNNPYLQNASRVIGDEITQNLMTNQLPTLRSGATQAGGAYSGASSKSGIAEGTAVSGTNKAISDSVTKMMFDAYNRGLTGMQTAVGQTGAVQNQQLMAPSIVGAVGGQRRAMEQALLDEEIRNFYMDQSLPFLRAQELMQLLQGMPGGTTTSTATGSTPSTSSWMSAGGGALSGTSLGSTFGPWGALLGAILGGGAGYFSGR